MHKEKNLKISGYLILGVLLITLVIPNTPLCTLKVSAKCNPVVNIQPRTITTSPGESFNLSIIIDSCHIEMNGLRFKMTYPSPIFSFQNLTYHNLIGANVWKKGGDNGEGIIDYTFGRGNGNLLTTVNGSFATIHFKVSSTAPLGMYKIWFENHLIDYRDAYTNDTPPHYANINVVASGGSSGDVSGGSSGDRPTIDIQQLTFSVSEPICINVALNSYNVPVRTVGLHLWYPSSFHFLDGTYENLLGLSSQVLQVGGDDGNGFINYAVTRLLQTGNSPIPVNGTFIVLCFGSIPEGIYEICFECEVYDSANELISSFVYQCVNITIEEDTISEGNVTGEQSTNCGCIYGDANCDCIIDIFDFDALVQAWGSCRDCGDPRYRESLDCNQDGVIDIFDLDYITGHWGMVYCDRNNCENPQNENNSTSSGSTSSGSSSSGSTSSGSSSSGSTSSGSSSSGSTSSGSSSSGSTSSGSTSSDSTTSSCHKGDCDLDGDVDAADKAVFDAALGSCYPDSNYKECCDFDDDGCIGLIDSYRMDLVLEKK